MTFDWHDKRDIFDHHRVPQMVRDLWDGDPHSLRLVGQDYNIVYRFEAQGDGYYLRIGHTSLHPLNKVHHVMHFLRFLAENDVPVGRPIPSVNGKYIEILDGGYYAAAQTEAPGEEMTYHVLDVSVYETWGQSLGKLHEASRRYQPSPDIDYEFPTVKGFWKNIELTVATAPIALQKTYAELTDYMNQLPEHDWGLIHGDYRPGNVIWDGKSARTVDFDEPNYHWYIADISRALLELYQEPVDVRRNLRKAFMCGYQSVSPLDEFWVTQLPRFGQLRGMLMAMWDLQEGGSGTGAFDWALKPFDW